MATDAKFFAFIEALNVFSETQNNLCLFIGVYFLLNFSLDTFYTGSYGETADASIIQTGTVAPFALPPTDKLKSRLKSIFLRF